MGNANPIFVATHTRSCSTAFERIFMKCRDTITCFHEPFGEAFYYGPERVSNAWQSWPAEKIEKSGLSHVIYDLSLQTILEADRDDSKRVFIKDLTYHFLAPSHAPNAIAPSLRHLVNPNDAPNPTMLPTSILSRFQFVFLIRDPSASIPSKYRCVSPPLSEKTGNRVFDTRELGYREMRVLLDFLYPDAAAAATSDSQSRESGPILIDADDLLADPEDVVGTFCLRVDLPFRKEMLSWDRSKDHSLADSLFRKFYGYHEDALHSTGLRSKTADREAMEGGGRGTAKTRFEEDAEWQERYGEEAARKIQEAVDSCKDDYEYLKNFRLVPD